MDACQTTDANIASHLSFMAATQPERLAIACPVSGRPWSTAFTELSFKQLDDWSQNLARGLVQAGIGKGTRVALLVPPGPEFFAVVFALMKSGAIMICIDPGIGLKALGRCINHAQPRVMIGSGKAHLARRLFGWGHDSNCLNIHTTRVPLILPGDRQANRSLHSIAEAGKREDMISLPEIKAEDPAAILFTSGSTGPPKGVIYTHATFQAQIRMLRECYDMTPGEVDLSTFPLFALFAPALGMSAVIPKMNFTRPARARPRNIIQAVNRYGVTSLFGSPALLRRLGRWNRRHSHTLPSLRRIISAGAPVQASVLADLVPMLAPEARIHTPYGATEILPVTTIASDEILSETAAQTAHGKGICVGRPVAEVQVGIIVIGVGNKANGDPVWLNAGAVGEIVVAGPNLSLGYDDFEEAQRLSRFSDSQGRNWHRMGDAGYIDDQGRLWFCGRVAHRVITHDRTYYPIPCEGVFNDHPQVYRSALIRLETSDGIRPGLCVELEARESAVSRRKICAELLEMGSRFEQTREIRKIFFHPAFPVDIRHNAKIDRERLGRWARSRS
jgi:acyl-CoA synthetase (AMP-forming)/AMP-acid ligase II